MSSSKNLALSLNKALKKIYPESSCSLDFKNPLELMVATILSSQCKDERVNKVTVSLFKRFKSAKDYAEADLEELEKYIFSTGFFKAKAKAIKLASIDILKNHKGKIPDNMDDLVKLHGIGRKTANVILGTGFLKAEGIVVDTHVGRISQRFKLTQHKDPVKIEKDLLELIPKKDWISISHRLIDFGRDYCRSKNPLCDKCPLFSICPYEDRTI